MPAILVAPVVVFGARARADAAQVIAVVVFWVACCVTLCLIKRAGGPRWVVILLAAYPIIALVYWLTVGSAIQFGDAIPLQGLADQAATCWDNGSASSGCLLQLGSDTRYVLSSLYHGLRVFLYGDDPLITVCWGSTTLLAVGLLALPGLRLSGLTRAEALTVFAGILLWPDFLNMASTVGRDILILWGIVAWYSGVRYALLRRAALGAAAALCGIAVLAYSRPAYCLIATLDLAILLLSTTAFMRRRSGAVRVAFLLCAFAAVIFALSRGDETWIAVVAQSGTSQAVGATLGFGESSGRVGGGLAALTGFGLFISLPIRLVMAVMAPFPWTSGVIFHAEFGGFNGSVTALGCHIAKSVVALSAFLAALSLLWRGLRKNGPLSLLEYTNAPIFLALAAASCITDTGFNRYVAISYPFLAASILQAKATLPGRRTLRNLMSRSALIVTAGTLVVLAIYN